MTGLPKQRLRVGFVGSGFIAEFHLKGILGVRNVDVTGVFSRKPENRARLPPASPSSALASAPATTASNR